MTKYMCFISTPTIFIFLPWNNKQSPRPQQMLIPPEDILIPAVYSVLHTDFHTFEDP